MAFSHTATLPVRTTAPERAALAAAARLVQLVGQRMASRSAQLSMYVSSRSTRSDAINAREACIQRAHTLGLLPR